MCSSVNVFKVNTAFYYACGPDGYRALQETIKYIHHVGSVVIFDDKRGDTENTNEQHAYTAYTQFEADAVTVTPSSFCDISPFLGYQKGVFVVCYPSTGNLLAPKLYKKVVRYFANMRDVGFVVGAGNPKILRHIQNIIGTDQPILIPGVGVQGADIEDVIPLIKERFLINAGRSVLYGDHIEHNFVDMILYRLKKFNTAITKSLATC